MKEKVKKIAGIFMLLAGILELILGIGEKAVSTILIGIAFCLIGSLYFCEKNNNLK